MQKYILFDFDGTIGDTNELILLSLNKTAEKYMGRKLDMDEIHSIFGKYLEDQMKQLYPEKSVDMVNFYREFYKTHMEDMTKAFPGIREMFSGLKDLGCKTAIVSAKGRSGIEHGIKKLGIADFIDVIISAYDIKNNKPHPEPALKALKLLGCENINFSDTQNFSNQCFDEGQPKYENDFVINCSAKDYFPEKSFALMVGDSPYDILCGKNAGIKTALVDWTIFPKETFTKLKPDFHLKTPSELVKIITYLPS